MNKDQELDRDHQEKLKNLDSPLKQSEFIEMLEELPTSDVVDFLEDKDPEEITKQLAYLSGEDKGRIFSDFSKELQLDIFHLLDRRKFADYFRHMYSDVRADLYQEFSKEEQIELLPYLEKKVREDVMILSAYPPDTAGGIMSTDFATIFADMTAMEALAKIRKDAPSKEMIYDMYVVDSSIVLKGMVTLKELVMAEPTTLVAEMIQEFFVYAEVNEDREEVAHKIEKYDLVAIPVVNSLKQLVGVVTHEEAIDVIRAEQTEDMEKFMGIMPSEEGEDYLSVSSLDHFKRRVIWLVGLASIGIVSGMIINQYKNILEQFIILAMYMPMMAATGGNTGSQAATVVIRALSLDQIDNDDWLQIVLKELRISFLLSLCVALLTYLKIVFLSFHTLLPETFSLERVGVTIAVAIAIQVMSSAIIGAGLPLIVRRFNGDPAVVASPAITTFVDITGLLIYFSIASSILGV